MLHLDVMDGLFVPNISFGMPVIQAVRKMTAVPFQTHLMIERPERFLQDFRDAGSDEIIVHEEATTHLHRAIQAIHATGAHRGSDLQPLRSVLVELAPTRQSDWERFVDRSGLADGLPRDYAEAISAVAAFADPILTGEVTSGRWYPSADEWRSVGRRGSNGPMVIKAAWYRPCVPRCSASRSGAHQSSRQAWWKPGGRSPVGLGLGW